MVILFLIQSSIISVHTYLEENADKAIILSQKGAYTVHINEVKNKPGKMIVWGKDEELVKFFQNKK